MNPLLLNHINALRGFKGLPSLDSISAEQSLRVDMQLDSLDLAELTVRLQKDTGVDVFAEGLVSTIGEVNDRLPKG